jgi:hypothetical protein
MKAEEMKALAEKSIDRVLLSKAIAKCEADIRKEASKGENRLTRNPYFCYMDMTEDRGVKDALVKHLKKNGFTVKDGTCSLWIGALYISWGD